MNSYNSDNLDAIRQTTKKYKYFVKKFPISKYFEDNIRKKLFRNSFTK